MSGWREEIASHTDSAENLFQSLFNIIFLSPIIAHLDCLFLVVTLISRCAVLLCHSIFSLCRKPLLSLATDHDDDDDEATRSHLILWWYLYCSSLWHEWRTFSLYFHIHFLCCSHSSPRASQQEGDDEEEKKWKLTLAIIIALSPNESKQNEN